MSWVFKDFHKNLRETGMWKKVFANHNPGQRIAFAKAKDGDAKRQLRMNAGEVVKDMKNVNVQINSEATNDALQKFRKKNGKNAKVATGKIPVDTPEDKQEEVFEELFKDLKGQFSEKIG